MIYRLGLVASLVAVASVASAQQTFSTRKTDVRAGVILPLRRGVGITAANRYVPSAAPHAFYNLDSVNSIKPAGWNFINPLGAGFLSSDDYARWSAFDPTINTAGFASRVNAGLRLQKSHAAYWEVKLDEVTDADLSEYDILLLAPASPAPIQLNPEDREKLRKFVDKGGTLWIEAITADAGSGTLQNPVDPTNGYPYTFDTVNAGTNWVADLTHPLMQRPNEMSLRDIGWLQNATNFGISPAVPGTWAPGLDLLQNSMVSEFAKLTGVSFAANRPTIATAKIGDGFVVVTSRIIAQKVNRTQNDPSYVSNVFFNARPAQLSAEGVAAAKFGMNLAYLSAESAQTGAGSRKNFSNAADLGAPLLRSFADPFPTPKPSFSTVDYNPPVVFKGMVFVSTANQVIAYDAEPASDIDQDGNPDDGFQDLSDGEDRDILFRTAPLAGGISAPVCAEVPDAQGGAPTNIVAVTDGQGRLHVYQIFSTPNGRTLRVGPAADNVPTVTGPITPGAGAAVATGTPIAPSIVDGLAFVFDSAPPVSGTNGGRIWVADLRTLTVLQSPLNAPGQSFEVGLTAQYNVPRWCGFGAVGEIPVADSSGGYDKVVYAPFQSSSTPVQQNTGVVSYWFAAKGERPFRVERDGGDLVVTTRANQAGLPIFLSDDQHPLGIKISSLDDNGRALTGAQLSNLFTGARAQSSPGQLRLGLTPAGQALTTDDWNGRIRIDYTIDWAAVNSGQKGAIERGRVNFPDVAGARQVLGGVALSPNGNLFCTVGRPIGFGPNGVPITQPNTNEAGGSLFGVREEGRGNFKLVLRWDLHASGLNWRYNGGSARVNDLLPDHDPLQYLDLGGFSIGSILGGPLRRVCFVSPPSIRNGTVYVTGIAQKGPIPFLNVGVLMAFNENPPTPEIALPVDVGSNFTIAQPDPARSTNALSPEVPSRLTSNFVTVERGANGAGSLIRLDNLMTATRGAITDSINLSLPVNIQRQGQPDLFIDPSMSRDRWSPLRWYTIMHGVIPAGAPVVTGNTVFVAGTSYVPDVLDGNASIGAPPRPFGYVTALRADIDISSAVRVTDNDAARFYPNLAAYTPTAFEARTVVADGLRPYLRQVISMDFPRDGSAVAGVPWQTRQLSLSAIVPNPNYVWPQAPQNSAERGRISFDDFKLRIAQAIVPGATTALGAVPGAGTLVAWNASGLTGFRKIDLWVADEGRITKVDSSGNTLFDSTASIRFGEGVLSSAGNSGKLSRPTRIKQVPGSQEVLVVESGANRVLRMQPTGFVRRSISELNIDPASLPVNFRSGDPVILNNPRDVVVYQTYVTAAQNRFSNPRPLEQWTHYLIADAGNRRLVDVVDRIEIDSGGNAIAQAGPLGTLAWVSPAPISGGDFSYVSVNRFQLTPTRGVVVAGIGSNLPGRNKAGELIPGAPASNDPNNRQSNGGIVIIDPAAPNGYLVYNGIAVPGVDAINRWNDRTGNWTDSGDAEANQVSLIARGTNIPAQPNKPFVGVQSVTATLRRLPIAGGGTAARILIMVADASGVYEVAWDPTQAPANLGGQALTARWMITSDAYRNMRRALGQTPSTENADQLFATYARRIDDDNVLIVNGYVGWTRGVFTVDNTGTRTYTSIPQRFNGEIVQIDGRISALDQTTTVPRLVDPNGFHIKADNLGFNARSIRLRLGPIEGGRELILPVFADRS